MCYDILDQLHQKDKLQFIINKYEKGTIKPADFSKMFGTDIYYVIPYDGKAAISSVNKGMPAVISQPRSSLANALNHLTDKVISEHSGVEQLSGPVKRKKPKLNFKGKK